VLAMAFHSLSMPDSARYYCQAAEDQSEKFFMPEITWRACKEKAAVYVTEKNNPAAINAFYKALNVIESLRNRVKVDDYSAGFMDDKAEVYGQLLALLVDQGQAAESWHVVERARSRSFLDLVGNRALLLSRPQDDRMMAQGDSLQTLLQQAESNMLYWRSVTDTTRYEKLATAEQQVNILRTNYSTYLKQMAAANPNLSDLVQVAPPNLQQLQAGLPDSVALIEYYSYADQLYCWFITRSDLNVRQVTVTDQALDNQVNALRKALQRQLSVIEPSQALYALLIKPIAGFLPGYRHLVFAPFRNLHYLPFAVLMDETGQYLGLQYSLSVTPSASVLLHCLAHGDSFAGTARKQEPVMAFGNPKLLDDKWDLPFAGREVKSLSRFYPRVVSFLNEKATETQVKEAALSALLLFSCHGEFDETHPMMSAILLSADKKNDGRLCSYEIMGLNLNTYITAVSACETGLGALTGGDEVVGLVRSFIFAGSSSVLSSLWKVDDLATAVLVKRFFRYVAEGDSRSEALRKAQKVVYEQINPYPSFWAGFTITGDFR
jgi:CHAT domain-containing protein